MSTGTSEALAALARPSRARAGLRIAAETIACASVAAWVGGHAALGAYAARILFRDLPRGVAAPAMTTIFHSFDTLIGLSLALLFVAMVARAAALGRDGLRGPHLVAMAATGALLLLGLAGIGWVHPAIERMFEGGDTLSPAFAAMHKLSERLGHAQALLAVTLFGAFAWGRARSS